MVNSRAKGKRGELEARDQVRTHWLARECIRAGQACGKFASDLLKALPGAHIEAKRYHRIAAFDFWKQAERDRQPDEFSVVLMREDGSKDWLVAFAIKDSKRFIDALRKQLEEGHGVVSDPELGAA